jgi:hypothetical protein
MIDFVTDNLAAILSFLAGLGGGSLITLYFCRNRVHGSGSIVDQSDARAGGDIVGGDKKTTK